MIYNRYFRCTTFIFLLFLSGCAEIGHFLQVPDEKYLSKIHSLGIQVYDMSGKEFTESDWEAQLYLIESAFITLKKCLDFHDVKVEKYMRSVRVVILPPQKIEFLGKELSAYTDLENIFIRLDKFDMATLGHEWIHIYLWAANKRFFGDPFHRDKLFSQCENIKTGEVK